MTMNLERKSYTLSYEDGQLTRRGTTRIRGHEVTLYTNFSKFPHDVRGVIGARLLIEVARATGSDPESVRKLLLKNYGDALETQSKNALQGIYDHVPVTVISYTVDPRRRPLRIDEAPIVSSSN